MISVERVCFWYSRGATVLDDVSLTISDGDVVLLMGENGSGKTTLAKLLNGLLKPKSGRVVVDGLDTREHSVAELCRIVGYVPQNPEHQFFAENAAEEVAFGLRNLGLGDKEALDEALSVLRK
ncbi:MAG: ABC transporter ATP-binding protein, partial [Thermoproteota archaeon]